MVKTRSKRDKFKALLKLKRLCDSLAGKKPCESDLNMCDFTPSGSFYRYHFGSLYNALSLVYPNKYNSKERYTKEFLIYEFRRVRDELEYVPTYQKMKELSKIHPCIYQSRFGSWNKFLQSVGITKRDIVKRPGYINRHNSKNCLVAKDGHICYSYGELKIDNFFFDNSIKHKKEVKYPFHPIFNKNTRKVADWLIGNIYVEYLGMLSHYSPHIKNKYSIIENEKSNMLLDLDKNFMFITPDNIRKNKIEILEFLGGK